MDGPAAHERQSSTGAPWRPGNEFRFLHENGEFFARMLSAIDAAAQYVLLEMYLVNSGVITTRFCNALVAAGARGVRVCVLFDGFGALGLRNADRRRLVAAGVELRFFNPVRLHRFLANNLLRNHRKLLLIDGCVAFVGGAGLTDDFAPGARRGAWRELMVEIAGPVVADWQRAFAVTWARFGPVLEVAEPAPEGAPQGALGRISLSEARGRSDLASDVLRRIETARDRAWIMSAYFVPSRRFRTALRRAARRGVDVRLLLPGPRTDHPWVRHAARRFYAKLLRNAVKIWEYQPSMLHAKMVLCDDWVSVGSANLDRWSFRWNLEANQEIDSTRVADAARALFERDFLASRSVSRRHWGRRHWLDRVRENIAGRLDRLLDSWRRP
ncbi:MAG: phosphatidylserine/phosphatidylglycerophosphate/cardiolipin synthase family protein [Proteobacteria bacterium]|nr:phosphatidylserine/phosphatidylglycerophosphate/cardiolipin synthase family protein [Pseudomonadota bacterium]